MKNVLTKNNLTILILCSTILYCKNRTENIQQKKINKSVINKKIEKLIIDSLNISEYKVILNKIYKEKKLIYEIEIFNHENKTNAFEIPYHFISVNDTLQADDLGLSKNIFNSNNIKKQIKNGFVIEFWQSKTLFQYLVYFEEKNLYLRGINRITEEDDLNKKFEICEVILNENLNKLSTKKIDSIVNNFDNVKIINRN